ncbi:MAG: hypothetical protein WBK59_03465 [Acholeplasmatales bacterium]|jgi:hypothetical protein
MRRNRALTLLKRVGMSTFVKYYQSFRTGVDVIFEEEYTQGSINTKINTGRKIFRENLERIALEIVTESRNTSAETRQKARELLEV